MEKPAFETNMDRKGGQKEMTLSPNQRMTAGLFQRMADYVTAAAAQLHFENSISVLSLWIKRWHLLANQ